MKHHGDLAWGHCRDSVDLNPLSTAPDRGQHGPHLQLSLYSNSDSQTSGSKTPNFMSGFGDLAEQGLWQSWSAARQPGIQQGHPRAREDIGV